MDKEVVSIVGASGAGKTTLLQIIGTLDHPDGGSVYFTLNLVSRLKERALASLTETTISDLFSVLSTASLNSQLSKCLYLLPILPEKSKPKEKQGL